MNKTTIVSVGVFCILSFNKMNAQNQTPTTSSQTKESSWTQASQAKAEKPYVTPSINENDPYMGRTEEFLHVMVVDKLPADFPKYDKSYGLRYYNNLVDNYFKLHLDLLQERYKQKILATYNH